MVRPDPARSPDKTAVIDECRLMVALQEIYGYVLLGIFVAMLVTVFSGAIRTPHR